MPKNQYKIVRLTETGVSNAFKKENELVEQVKSGRLKQALLLWQPDDLTLVLPASKKWLATDELKTKLSNLEWNILHRRTGGAPVPQTSGIINVSHIYVADQNTTNLIKSGYENLCNVLKNFFHSFGINAETHATPNSYCDGDYNLNINKRKIIGTAQRILTTKEKHKIVLAQACILIDDDLEQLIHPINLCYELNQHNEQIQSNVHTCLREHVDMLPDTQALYKRLIEA
ncbi:lipoate--protein ligase family protein, partial [Marinomonas epiphytica]